MKHAGPPSIAIIGFGYIGCTIGSVLADQGYLVTGIELNDNIRKSVQQGNAPFAEPGLQELVEKNVASGRIQITNDYASVTGADIILVSVGTPLGGEGQADLTAIMDCLNSVAEYARDDQLVVLKSTLPPGTTKDVIAPIFSNAGKRVGLVFCPERIAEGQAIEDLKSIPIVVGGMDDRSSSRAADFFREALGVDVVTVSDPTTAEMSKLADNLWVDLNIALANEIAMLSNKLNIDSLDVIEAANSLPKGKYNVNILAPSVGVGGYCLTKDPWFVEDLGRKYGLELKVPAVSRTVNDRMPSYAANMVLEDIAEQGGSPSKTKIAILGLSFKSNTGDCRSTPTRAFMSVLKEAGCQLFCYDPWVSEEDFSALCDQERAGTINQVLYDADVIAFLTGHEQFQDLPLRVLAEQASRNALVFDGRMYFTRKQIKEIRRLGLRYMGVGR